MRQTRCPRLAQVLSKRAGLRVICAYYACSLQTAGVGPRKQRYAQGVLSTYYGSIEELRYYGDPSERILTALVCSYG